MGSLGEVALNAEKLTLVMRMLSDEYFFAILLSQQGNLGKCRFLMRMATPKLVDETIVSRLVVREKKGNDVRETVRSTG